MRVLVDTDVWSEAFRRRSTIRSPQVVSLESLIRDGRVQMIGAIRLEVLSGLREKAVYERLRLALSAFPDRHPETREYELAADFFNACRAKGIQSSATDMLICACSANWKLPILTKDRDFEQYASLIPILLVDATAKLQ